MSDAFALLVVGGGPAGLAAARGYRAGGGAGPVAIITDEHRPPYRRPPLTKELLRGESDESQLPLEDDDWYERSAVSLVSGRVVALEARDRAVALSGGRHIAYGQCVLTAGAEPTRLPVPGSDHPRVRVVRTLDHMRELHRSVTPGEPVAVIGSGFIGCEISSSLRMRGHPVALVSDEAAPNARRLGAEAGAAIRDWLAHDDVDLHLGAAVERINHAGGVATVCTGEARIPCRLVVMATGVRPRSELAAAAGIELADGAVPVTSAMRTGLDGLLAAGDVCRADNAAAGRPLRVEHWGDALNQGEIAGRTAAGEEAQWDSVPGFWSTIGRRTLKYAAWGDGYEHERFERHRDGGFTVWYGGGGRLVGVLTHQADDDYERGRDLIGKGATWN